MDSKVATPFSPVQSRQHFKREREFLRRFRRRPVGVISVSVIAVVIFFAIFSEFAATHDPIATDFNAPFAGPSSSHFFGTDNLGRDTYSRIVHGARTAVFVGFISVGIAVIVGLPWGLMAGYLGGRWDEALMRAIDAVYAFPALLLALLVIAALGTGIFNVMIAIGVTFIPVFARLTRASTLSAKNQDYVLAAEALGAGSLRIVSRHVLPNVLAPIIVQASLSMGFAVIAEASLSFLGLGTQPPQASWGSMLQAAQRYLTDEGMLAVYPGLAIVITVLALNLLGDILRDLLDPRLRAGD